MISSTLTMLLCCSVAFAGQAQPQAGLKTVAVVSFAGYESLRQDVDFVGKLIGNPELIQGFDGLVAMATQAQGLRGIDRNRPWGLGVVTDDDKTVRTFGFIPVTDADKLFDLIALLIGPLNEADDGAKQLVIAETPLLLKPKGGWLYVGIKADDLRNLPADPSALLGSLAKDYDLAARVTMRNLPVALRTELIDSMREKLEDIPKNEGESDEEYQLRVDFTQQLAAMVIKLSFDDADQLTLGWKLDEKLESFHQDLLVTLVTGSALLKVPGAPEPASRFAGFMNPAAPVHGHWNLSYRDDVKKLFESLTPAFRMGLDEALKKDDESTPADKELFRAFFDELIAVGEATIDSGNFNGGVMLANTEPLTYVAATSMPQSRRLEAAFKKLIVALEGRPQLDTVKIGLDSAEHRGVKFHRFSAPWPEDGSPTPKKILGEQFVATLGFGDDCAYLAIGEKGIDQLKAVIDAPATARSDLLPAQFTVLLRPLLAMVLEQAKADAENKAAEKDDDDFLQILRTFVEAGPEGNDKIEWTITPVANGFQLRASYGLAFLQAIANGVKVSINGGPKAGK